MAAAVHEHKRTGLAKPSQIEPVAAGAAAVDRLFLRQRHQQRGHVVDDIGQGELAGGLDILGSQRLHRQGAGQVGIPRNARTGDDHLFDDVLLGECLLIKRNHGGGQQNDSGPSTERNTCFH